MAVPFSFPINSAQGFNIFRSSPTLTYMHQNETVLLLTPFTKTISEWIQDLKVEPKSIQFLVEIREILHNTGFDNNFLDTIPKA